MSMRTSCSPSSRRSIVPRSNGAPADGVSRAGTVRDTASSFKTYGWLVPSCVSGDPAACQCLHRGPVEVGELGPDEGPRAGGRLNADRRVLVHEELDQQRGDVVGRLGVGERTGGSFEVGGEQRPVD